MSTYIDLQIALIQIEKEMKLEMRKDSPVCELVRLKNARESILSSMVDVLEKRIKKGA